MSSKYILYFSPSSSLSAYEVSAVITLDNKEIEQTKWAVPSNTTWDVEFKLDLHQNRELEIGVLARDGDTSILCGLVYLRLEDYFEASNTAFCLPLEPQGILVFEATYEIPRTERRQPKLKRGRKLFKRKWHPRFVC